MANDPKNPPFIGPNHELAAPPAEAELTPPEPHAQLPAAPAEKALPVSPEHKQLMESVRDRSRKLLASG